MISLKVKMEIDRLIHSRFKEVVKASFGKRRKTLKNNLKSSGYDIDGLSDRIDLSRRPEELSVENFVFLTKLISEINEKKPG